MAASSATLPAATKADQIPEPAQDLNTSDSFFAYFQSSLTNLQDQISALEDTSNTGGERADAIAYIQSSIAHLSDSVKDASAILPAHDQRSYGEAIKALSAKLEDVRKAFAPRPRFAFKTRGSLGAGSGTGAGADAGGSGGGGGGGGGVGMQKKNESAISISDAAELARQRRKDVPGYRSGATTSDEGSSFATTPAHLASPAPETAAAGAGARVDPLGKAVKIAEHEDAHIILPPSARHATASGTLAGIRRCVVDLSGNGEGGSAAQQPFAGLTVKGIERSLVICGHVAGAVHLTGVEDSVVVVAARQFRMHESRNTRVYLQCGSRPIIEGCTGIGFAPLPERYLSEEEKSGLRDGVEREKGMWREVDDFKWLRAERSPNWRILEGGERVDEEVWREKVGGGPGVGVGDVLAAVGVTI